MAPEIKLQCVSSSASFDVNTSVNVSLLTYMIYMYTRNITIFMPLPIIVGESIVFWGCPSVRPSFLPSVVCYNTPTPRDAYLCTSRWISMKLGKNIHVSGHC